MSMHLPIRDPGLLPWGIVIGYLVAALLTFRAGSVTAGRERILWLGTGAALILLGINKQLDLQTDLTLAAKVLAHREGWYNQWRRDVQGIFILLVAVGAIGFVLFLWRWLRDASANAKVAAMGLVILAAFIFVRAASFHHIDYWVTVPIAGMRSGWWLELIGIAVIGAAAAFRGRRQPSVASSG
jgi:hypothetical protein